MNNEYFSSIFNTNNTNNINNINNTNTGDTDDTGDTIPNMYNDIVISDNLDTPNYAMYKPLLYNPKSVYFWRRDILIPEGIRRAHDNNDKINKIKTLLQTTFDEKQKQILQDELDLHTWQSRILSLKKFENSNEDDDRDMRDMRDIITDYFPNELGMVRPWMEIHSHIH